MVRYPGSPKAQGVLNWKVVIDTKAEPVTFVQGQAIKCYHLETNDSVIHGDGEVFSEANEMLEDSTTPDYVVMTTASIIGGTA